jgi:hypothetical protein
MTRSDVVRDIETHLFEVLSQEPLRNDERYAIQQQLPDMDGHLAYLVIGGKGTRAVLLTLKTIPDQPFLVMRQSQPFNGSTQVYDAIALSALEDIVDRLEA